ncbi:response regulator [Erythrobacter oryzae]|uniref:response regulator n=1 Tax=Erythrobacter oryzae TaxID=3019556 RepID=UPI002553FCCB|nr:response regulator [Erythrobacter sp. COR-2]
MTIQPFGPQPFGEHPFPRGPAPCPRVLVVDDTLTVRLYCAQLLAREGFEVAEAVNGVEALEQALEQDFDLFVVDINMARMDGYAFLAEVRRTPALQAIPAVMLSTEAAEGDIARAYQAGANFYLTKPVDPERFVATVKLMTGVPCR